MGGVRRRGNIQSEKTAQDEELRSLKWEEKERYPV